MTKPADRLAQALRASVAASDLWSVVDACKLSSGSLGETERYLLAFGFLMSIPYPLRKEVCEVALTGHAWPEHSWGKSQAELMSEARNFSALAHDDQRKALLVALCEDLTDEARVALRKWLAGVK